MAAETLSIREDGLGSNREVIPRDPEFAIHLLAQLPPTVRLIVGGELDSRIAATAEAYGLAGRLERAPASRSITFVVDRNEVDLAELPPGVTIGAACDLLGDCKPSLIDPTNDVALAGHHVVIVTNLPAHYRVPLFEGIARRLEAVGARFSVLFLAEHDAARPWLAGTDLQFEHTYVSGIRVPIRRRAPRLPLGLDRRLRSLAPTIVLVAGFSPLVAPRVVRSARAVGASVGLWSGETSAMPSARSESRRRLRKHLAGDVGFAVVYGGSSLEYLRGLAPSLPAVIGRNTSPILESSPTDRDDSAAIRMLFIGDLASPRKGCDVALDAMRHLPEELTGVTLRVIGSGRRSDHLARAASGDGRITFLGALQPSAVASELAAADVLLFPTRSDVFGLVLVEAMGTGVVPLVSRFAGATDDLAVDRVNAVVLDDLEPQTWATAIEALARSRDLLDRMRKRAARTVEARWTMAHSVDAMVAGLRLGALARERRP